jgi:hypothetical protein
LICVLILLVASLAQAARRTTPQSLVKAFICIHRHEGAWNDAGAPYYGGLQMDWSFMSAYGGEYLRAFGTADHWPPGLQIAVAIRGYLAGRGFAPWPVSSRRCGLS